MNKDTFQDRLKKLMRIKKVGINPSRCCNICGEDNPTILRKLEKHHIFGRANSDDIVILCPNCHAKITSEQNKLSTNVRKCSSTKSKKIFKYVSRNAMLKLIAEEGIKDANGC